METPPAAAAVPFSRKNPFPGTLLVSRRLSAADIDKDTRHYEIGIKGSGLIYEVGDSRDVNISIEKFLGRPRSLDPFLKKLGIDKPENGSDKK